MVLLPSICHQHLVVLSVNDGTGGWTIWDFITNRKLENERSSRLLRDIETEADVNHGEYPPFYNLEDPGHPERWELYLILRTIARHRRHSSNYDLTPPVAAPGDVWRPILPEPPWTPLTL